MSKLTHLPNVFTWVAEPMPSDVLQSLERLARSDDVQHVAVMPDVHLSCDVCVGAVVASRRLIYPAAVGNDIGCGMAAICFNASASLLAEECTAARVLAGLYRCVPAIKHTGAAVPRQLPDELQVAPLSSPCLEKLKARDGRFQFGTLGRGNHFLEFQADVGDSLWLMVHSGSRGIGQAIAQHHLETARRGRAGTALPALDAESAAGQAYLRDADWAIRYAEQNRLAMIRAVTEFLADNFGIAVLQDSLIHGNHNHVRRETHMGQTYWVHRKGAQSAAEGEPGIIPGSMGAASFHVSGRGHVAALCSSSHGAGRAMSRTEAAQKIGLQRLRREMQGVWFDQRRGQRLRDEAPSAYKNIHAVMRGAARADADRTGTEAAVELQRKLSVGAGRLFVP